MITPPFDYVAPQTVAEAVQLLRRHGDEAKVIAGGQSLIPMLRFRLLEPALLVDINRIEELAYFREEGGFLRLGALTRHSDVEFAPGLERRYPLLVATARVVADPLVRNRGTVAGSLAHADPAGDWGAALLAAGAQVVLTGPDGSRTLSVDDFLLDTFTTALGEDELLTEVRVPVPPERTGGAYLKLERKVGDFAIAAVGVQVTLNAAGECTRAGIGLCGVGSISLRARQAEEYLLGRTLTEDVLAEAASVAAEEADPVSDQRGPAEYKRDMVRVLTRRALQQAVERARAA
ncbi:carbon monoxide dehydrogenase, medium subunit [Thermaerobacter marianensis DSM 12885]|uniref:Carbon monoxide dehydrogenase, medium subunit n=1 Tax=Thermaerobacter marianensis (strain ATCC 700841 / DSM 12885 / JCM 10246 / 7p75a) TaxID=644966 RepID=E6SGF3_THEM7|nr:xanthine dehydrogenase family protein subunit M [Thermaerobacter marianensis]ADU51605.1 carbon monoxide dehydrogenase, medium subunit [Thermaerobacter marianensis DSM 12885]